MRKRGAKINHTRTGHIMTTNQVMRLVTPAHMAVNVLGTEIFTQQQAEVLAAFSNILQFAAKDAKRDDILKIAVHLADTVSEMHKRYAETQQWSISEEDHKELKRITVILDLWLRRQTNTRILDAIHRAQIEVAAAEEQGIKPLETIRKTEVPA